MSAWGTTFDDMLSSELSSTPSEPAPSEPGKTPANLRQQLNQSLHATGLAKIDPAVAEALNQLEQFSQQLALDNPRYLHIQRQTKQLRQQLQASLDRGARQAAQLTPIGHLQQWVQPRNSGQDRVMSCVQAIACFGPGLFKKYKIL